MACMSSSAFLKLNLRAVAYRRGTPFAAISQIVRSLLWEWAMRVHKYIEQMLGRALADRNVMQ
jgi:hypothetical protein